MFYSNFVKENTMTLDTEKTGSNEIDENFQHPLFCENDHI